MLLSYLENKFSLLKLRTKVELYLLPLLIFYLFYFFFETNEDMKVQTKSNIETFSHKKFQGSQFDIIKKIELYSLNKKIFLSKIEDKKGVIFINAISSLNKIKPFLLMIENLNNFTQITSFNMKRDKNKFNLKITISLNNFFIKKIKLEKKIKEKKSIKIIGIIDKYVFINDKWFTLNEIIDDKKIIKIDNKYIELEDKNKNKIRMEFKNEKFTQYPY